jgi:dihydrofolate reductase
MLNKLKDNNIPYQLIIAINELGFIGLDNKLPWKCPEDLKHFKKLTNNCIVIMGSKTFESLKCEPLTNRYNIVLTSEPERYKHIEETHGNVSFFSSYQQVEQFVGSILYIYDGVFILGGANVYEHFLTYENFDQILAVAHVSVIKDKTIGDRGITFTHIIEKLLPEYHNDEEPFKKLIEKFITVEDKGSFMYYKIKNRSGFFEEEN